MKAEKIKIPEKYRTCRVAKHVLQKRDFFQQAFRLCQ